MAHTHSSDATASHVTASDATERMATDGFCLIPGALEPDMIERLRGLSERKLRSEEQGHFRRYAHHGSLIPVHVEDDPHADLLTSPALHTAFRDLGFTDPRWISGYVITKPPRSPGLWWHQDWWAWDHDLSFAARPAQVFCMLYLQHTHEGNGALRVIPGSHRHHHELHDTLPEPHTPDIENQPQDSLSHLPAPGELTIEAHAGDLVIGDVRVLHATHPNRTDRPRTAVDLLFAPHFRDLPEEFRAHYVRQFCLPEAGWWREPGHPLRGAPVGRVLPTYEGPDHPPVPYRRRPRRRPATP
ncbi:phytanoyl-CoA dioxygenase family protein [Streptomyces sp. AV19]|uniref:phytanoyl-CoA dioxygenase family protein n=1 Tax=Streptomyces sp. AV19 TaxID=2793068 RepID=UPI0018FE5663|nr:phytanoyl-CoA dioxygenase family protein [Streptomyces sp. AV19]MBH1938393.1 phytanoyl-CoA dioxygenase family protein [Streptomyces sp. AV19]MDG4535042.1 phytanoyl-CoA dioxygenase family protein [Streptomyces sp. AV19]